MALKISYMYDYVTKSCLKQAEGIKIHLHPNVQLDNEEPCIGSNRSLKLAVVRPTTVQVTNRRLLRHNLLQKPALTDVLCISCISSVHCGTVIKLVWCP
jgi:hypothetical protein